MLFLSARQQFTAIRNRFLACLDFVDGTLSNPAGRKEFDTIPVDGELATVSAEIRSKYRVPMADSMIAASAKLRRLKCVTDDPHISEADEI